MAIAHQRAALEAAVARALDGRHLLAHRFYQRWEAGELSPTELARYAEQYRHFEAAVPSLLRAVVDQLAGSPAADLVRRNLVDEESNPAPHVELFDGFATAAGALAGVPATAATTALLDAYSELTASGPVAGIAAMVAYETQAPAIAATKAAGLRDRYGFSPQDTTFWDVHATMDVEHGDWGVDALEAIDADPAEVAAAAARAAGAWWAFLDERQGEATAAR